MVKIALYVHIPFCRRKCLYCSFVSYEGCEALIPAYVAALKKEMAHYQGRGYHLSSIYFGGGTPSLLPVAALDDILGAMRRIFHVLPEAEISLEANPGTVDEGYLAAIKKLGINRLSLGVQSLKDSELALLGRIHTASEALAAFRMARRAGFANINLDLIYGLPGQSVEGWRRTLEGALSLGVEHLSLYALSLEEGTPLGRAVAAGCLAVPDPDITACQYELAADIMKQEGFVHYELANWARQGYECCHNLTYWHNLPYIGIGAAAHSFLEGHRRANTCCLNDYIEACLAGRLPPKDIDETISPALELAETIILGLRLGEGVSRADILRRFGVDLFERYDATIGEMVAAGLLERSSCGIRLSRRGRLLGNEVFWRFLPDDAAVGALA